MKIVSDINAISYNNFATNNSQEKRNIKLNTQDNERDSFVKNNSVSDVSFGAGKVNLRSVGKFLISLAVSVLAFIAGMKSGINSGIKLAEENLSKIVPLKGDFSTFGKKPTVECPVAYLVHKDGHRYYPKFVRSCICTDEDSNVFVIHSTYNLYDSTTNKILGNDVSLCVERNLTKIAENDANVKNNLKKFSEGSLGEYPEQLFDKGLIEKINRDRMYIDANEKDKNWELFTEEGKKFQQCKRPYDKYEWVLKTE